jgi:hypothetical protein
MFNRLHAILEASSATRNGAARANKQYGGRDINLVLLIGGEMMQPQTVGGPEGGIGTGAQLTQVSRVGHGFYTVNTLDLTPGFLSRAFTFVLASPVMDVTEANFILVDSKGKQRKFGASLLPLRTDSGAQTIVVCDYPVNSATRQGKPFSFRLRVDSGHGAVPKIVRAESIWSAPEARGEQATKIKDLPLDSVFVFQPAEHGGGQYRFELSTDGLAPGKYRMQALIGERITTLFFAVRD